MLLGYSSLGAPGWWGLTACRNPGPPGPGKIPGIPLSAQLQHPSHNELLFPAPGTTAIVCLTAGSWHDRHLLQMRSSTSS